MSSSSSPPIFLAIFLDLVSDLAAILAFFSAIRAFLASLSFFVAFLAMVRLFRYTGWYREDFLNEFDLAWKKNFIYPKQIIQG